MSHRTRSGINLDDVLSDECCVPSCEAPAIPEDAPFPVCVRHYSQIVRHFYGAARSVGGSMSDERGQSVIPREAYVESQAPRKNLVYFIKFSDRVKVGTTSNLHQRLESLPYDEVLAVIPGGRQVEAVWHARFEPYHVTGEWFRADPFVMREIAKLSAA